VYRESEDEVMAIEWVSRTVLLVFAVRRAKESGKPQKAVECTALKKLRGSNSNSKRWRSWTGSNTAGELAERDSSFGQATALETARRVWGPEEIDRSCLAECKSKFEAESCFWFQPEMTWLRALRKTIVILWANNWGCLVLKLPA
jgi:hypothetical protein